MHPGPINAGIELSDDVACGPRSVIHQQVRNGVYVRMAALDWALDAASTRSSRSPQSTRSPAMRSKFNGDLVTGKPVQTG
ncbi:MAG: hypothetical protein ACRDF1_06380 [bacterium]